MRAVIVAAVLAGGWFAAPAIGFELGLPADCVMGETCFLQQGPDVDPASGTATDPFCGGVTYDGHSGTDIRIRSMAEAGSVNVIAAMDGVVTGFRDGVADRLVMTEADRTAVNGKECGNGVALRDEEGWETQYCHMQLGSVTVTSGQQVKRGDVLGKIGASGLAQFPHVELTVRKDGTPLDPFTGREIGAGCEAGTPLWSPAATITGWDGSVLNIGFADGPIDHAALVANGAPPAPDAQSAAFVGWVWFANLRKGDEVTIRLETADGTTVAESSQPIDRNKADYSAFSGKRGAPAPGIYRVKAVLIRNGVPALTAEKEIEIR